MGYVIAIDGPAGAGKSTIARKVAAAKGYIYVDTGALYRAIALYLIRQGVLPEDMNAIGTKCQEAEVSICYRNQEQMVLLGQEVVNGFLRTPEVSHMASVSSSHPNVRAKLLDLQRDLARTQSVVMDGRDIGTHVVPDAQLKIFLTASVEERARRRFAEMFEKGQECDLNQIMLEIQERDDRDRNRAIAPLCQAKDAHYIDSTSMTADEVTEIILKLCGNVTPN